MIDAGLGRKEEALREGRRACELLPISKDAIDGVTLAVNLAQIYSWTGEKDLAIEEIAAVERVPNYLTYGLLQLHPYWDSLRGDPRFEKIVASLAQEAGNHTRRSYCLPPGIATCYPRSVNRNIFYIIGVIVVIVIVLKVLHVF
jgi:hypothetical protein